ncbi:MAG TPA: folylpolyglutamate synthase/dihydrofolate synthase family protein [Candidatus Saccharimonadaceae bacterium]|nr:folylpolyglutamate synthase/dihydrofolate synthase family protein [Candidatus Saccharimonadaceae bacterium]
MSHSLQHALEALYGLERRRDKLGLDGTRALLAALDHPERRFHSIHVAGTNGKGSTCALIERVLREAGIRTGLFTSPHLVDFRERIRVAGRWADEAALAERLPWIEAQPAGQDRTFFEVATALGFDAFARAGVTWAVVEVGLGGRLDTTNVLEPEACVITSIGLDHTEILGDTIAAIAAEKGGIIKPGVPVVLAPDLVPAARETLETIARERDAPVVDARALLEDPRGAAALDETPDRAATGEAPGRPPRGFRPAHVATALAALDLASRRGVAISPTAFANGLARARWPGRFERSPREPRLWWDGAHNADGVRALVETWRARGLPAPGAVVLALSRDKDAPAMLRALAPLAGDATLVATRSRNERALEPERLAAAAAAYRTRVVPDVAAACRAALDDAGPERLVLLLGSLFAVGEAMEAFGGAPGEWL